jgi:hypothetical protein
LPASRPGRVQRPRAINCRHLDANALLGDVPHLGHTGSLFFAQQRSLAAVCRIVVTQTPRTISQSRPATSPCDLRFPRCLFATVYRGVRMSDFCTCRAASGPNALGWLPTWLEGRARGVPDSVRKRTFVRGCHFSASGRKDRFPGFDAAWKRNGGGKRIVEQAVNGYAFFLSGLRPGSGFL